MKYEIEIRCVQCYEVQVEAENETAARAAASKIDLEHDTEVRTVFSDVQIAAFKVIGDGT